MHCVSICVLLLDNEKRFLRDTGGEKSKQLEKENGEGGPMDGEKATESCLNVINEITAG